MQGMPPPPMTPLEENLTRAYILTTQTRVQSSMMYRSAAYCLERCLDTEELYTLLRTTKAPISYRHQKDLEEKECVKHCGFKWDDLLQLTLTTNTENATKAVQTEMMTNMLMMMQQQQQQQ